MRIFKKKSRKFAKKTDKKLIKIQPEFLEDLEKSMALLAFDDCNDCPLSSLLDVNQRLKIASDLNSAILTSQKQDKGDFSFFISRLKISEIFLFLPTQIWIFSEISTKNRT